MFAQLHRLLPAVVALVEIRRDASELDQLVPLQSLRQRDVIEVVERFNACPHALIILFLDQEIIQRFVYRLVIVVLDRSQVRFDQRKLVDLGEDADGASVVHARRQNDQEIV